MTVRAQRSRGAALLAALLTVALVATLAAGAMWQQWRNVAIESAERARVQAAWVLNGALDWSRLVLREDARASSIDYLGEPWATPLAEARLSTFLSEGQTDDTNQTDAFLSGHMRDAQAFLNVTNLVNGQQVSLPAYSAFTRLFNLLEIAPTELDTLTENLLRASNAAQQNPQNANATSPPLLPQHVEELTWLGLAPASLARLKPFVTILPNATAVNLNTAGPEVIYAIIPGIDMALARQLTQVRQRTPFRSLSDVSQAAPGLATQLNANQHTVSTGFFFVEGRLRLDQTVVHETSLVQRSGQAITIIWRTRQADTPRTASESVSTMQSYISPP